MRIHHHHTPGRSIRLSQSDPRPYWFQCDYHNWRDTYKRGDTVPMDVAWSKRRSASGLLFHSVAHLAKPLFHRRPLPVVHGRLGSHNSCCHLDNCGKSRLRANTSPTKLANKHQNPRRFALIHLGCLVPVNHGAHLCTLAEFLDQLDLAFNYLSLRFQVAPNSR